jgi:membrane protein
VARALRNAGVAFIKDDCLRMSAALAYYSAFSLAPLLLIAVAIAGMFFGEEAVRGALEGELRQYMGPGAAVVVQDMVASASKPADSVLMSVVGLVLLLLGATGVFGQLQAALNKIWDARPPAKTGIRGFVRGRLLSFSMVLVTGFLLLVSMILTTLLQGLADHFGRIAGTSMVAWIAGSGALSFLIITLLFSAIFKILPDVTVRWRDVWTGAAFTTALFMLGKSAIGWYLGREATASSYGSAGSFVVMLMWVYYSSIILLFGAEFTESQSRTGLGGAQGQTSTA